MIIVNDVTAEPDQAKWFVDNKVRTSRYTWYNFVPVFLFQQFSRRVSRLACVTQRCRETQSLVRTLVALTSTAANRRRRRTGLSR